MHDRLVASLSTALPVSTRGLSTCICNAISVQVASPAKLHMTEHQFLTDNPCRVPKHGISRTSALSQARRSRAPGAVPGTPGCATELMLTRPAKQPCRAGNFSYCTVPNSGQDALLFGSLAVLITCVLQGKLSAVWVLIAGACPRLEPHAAAVPAVPPIPVPVPTLLLTSISSCPDLTLAFARTLALALARAFGPEPKCRCKIFLMTPTQTDHPCSAL